MRIAYIILAHKLPAQLARLVGRLDSLSASFFVHIDANTDEATCDEMISGLSGRRNVFFLPRQPCAWGDWSIVRAMIEGIRQVIRARLLPDYVVLLSGQDYPLRTPESIERFLTRHRGTSFLDVRRLPDYSWNGHGALDRFRGEPLPAGLEPHGGSLWCALAGDCAAYVVGAADRDHELVRFFERAWIPDELFLQTVLANSPFRDRLSGGPGADIYGVHYIVWRGEMIHPRTFDRRDYDRLFASGALFARKFDLAWDAAILDMIDATLDRQ